MILLEGMGGLPDEVQIINTLHGLNNSSQEEILTALDAPLKLFFNSNCQYLLSLSKSDSKSSEQTLNAFDWRLRDKLKTVTVALVLCLNIGVDPPDVIKTNPCAKLEGWVDPYLLPASKAMEAIGKNLSTQYEVLQQRARVKLSLDPSIEETKKMCLSVRRTSKDERLLFHYNGHGVPKPTVSGEIWVFNKNYTQYIPVSILDLQNWLGSPSMFVYDCSAAGHIVDSFIRFAKQRDHENSRLAQDLRQKKPPLLQDSYQFASCRADEVLPTNPDLPADIFSSCLTSPIEMAMWWFVVRNPLLTKMDPSLSLRLPGKFTDRRTPLGELNWVFTSITDTIAWTVLPSHMFKKLFRQDLMVAGLFRNFLLADRIMRSLKCHPISVPALPATHNHPLWKSWDLALDLCLAQLPALIAAEEGGPRVTYQSTPFFADQLKAFEVWLGHGPDKKAAPEQLPIVLQVLLSQVHRTRALYLLAQFLDLGRWAVDAALMVGIFPYVLKLLQSPALELRPLLTIIWARLLPVDSSCQGDLLKDNGFIYFIEILNLDFGHGLSNLSQLRSMCAFIVTLFCKDFEAGKRSCLKHNLLTIALPHLKDLDSFLRQWICLMVSQLWKDFPEAKKAAINLGYNEQLPRLLRDRAPEVRAAALCALTTLMDQDAESDHFRSIDHSLALSIEPYSNDGSPLIRREWVAYISHFVLRYQAVFLKTAQDLIQEERIIVSKNSFSELPPNNNPRPNSSSAPRLNIVESSGRSPVPKDASFRLSLHEPPSTYTNNNDPFKPIYSMIWKALLNLTVDPYPSVADAAKKVVDSIHNALFLSLSQGQVNSPSSSHSETFPTSNDMLPSDSNNTIHAMPSPLFHSKSNLSSTLRRSTSFTLKSLYNFSGSSSDKESAKPVDVAAPPTISHDSLNNPSLTPISNLNSEMQIVSDFIDLCCRQFQLPQMKKSESELPGSVVSLERQWRKGRNKNIIQETLTQSSRASNIRWSTEVTTFPHDYQPSALVFHRYEPYLVSADERGFISTFDWESHQRLHRFKIPDAPSVHVASLKLINEEDESILAIGLSDGGVRLYKNFWKSAELTSAFRAVTELPLTRKGVSNVSASSPGLVLEWLQPQGVFLVGGGASVIKVWDAHSETCNSVFPTRSTSFITSLTADKLGGQLVVAGFQDGSLRVYDRRLPSRESMVQCWREHHSKIVGCHLQEGSIRELVSSSATGEVKLWDIRSSASLRGFSNRSSINVLAVHDLAPLVARGTPNSGILVHTTQGNHLGTMYHYQGPSGLLMTSRVASVNTLAFHPRRMLLAAASGSTINSPGLNIDRPPHLSLFSWDSPIYEAHRPGGISSNLSGATVSPTLF